MCKPFIDDDITGLGYCILGLQERVSILENQLFELTKLVTAILDTFPNTGGILNSAKNYTKVTKSAEKLLEEWTN